MKEELRTELANEVVQTYLALGDVTRLASLPNWITAGLSLSQLKAIVLLEHHGPLIISELAGLLGIGNPAASILVQQLVEEGLLERSEDKEDRRRTYVQPTVRGIALLAGRRETIRANLLRWLSQLDDDELDSLRGGLGALLRVAQAERSEWIR